MNLRVLALATALLLTACQPSDVKVKSVKERLDAGQLVEFTKPGYRRPSCSQFSPDWTNLSLTDQAERERFVLRTQAATLNPGRHSCFRVGGIVNLTVEGKSNGRARIRKLGLIRLSNLQANQLKGKFFSKADDFARFKGNIEEKRMKAEHEGQVTIIEVEYLPGSATDQKAIEDKERDKNAGDGFEETSADGQRLGECPATKTWKEILAPEEFHAPILASQIKSWYSLGNYTCVSQGQEVEVKATTAGVSAGKVKITRIKMFKIQGLIRERFDLPDYDFEKLKEKILLDNSKKDKPAEWITVFDVESGSAPNKPVQCRPAMIEVLKDSDVNAKVFKSLLPIGTCLKQGDLVLLIVPVEGNKAAEIMAKVLIAVEQADGVFVVTERLNGGQP